ncbi:MAG TPA: transcription antitermination factor NusB [bacterium]|nr:transcription antitermination factor NusB [bacterium]
MGRRRRARELALQILFQLDSGQENLEEVLETFWALHRHPGEIKEFANRIVNGTRKNLKAIDQKIARYAEHWEIKRMPTVDRNILRLAAYELLYCPDIPIKVSLNEAVELAKKFSTEKSGQFVNALLDRIAHEKNEKVSRREREKRRISNY